MSIQDLFLNLNAVLPFTILMVWAMVLLLVDLVIPRRQKGITAALAALGLLVALVLTILRPADGRTAFVDMIIVDGFATFLNVIFLVSGILGVAVAYDYLKRMGIERGEYYSLLLFSITGMIGSMSQVFSFLTRPVCLRSSPEPSQSSLTSMPDTAAAVSSSHSLMAFRLPS